MDPRNESAGDGWGCRTRACLLAENRTRPRGGHLARHQPLHLPSLPHLLRQSIWP